MGLFDERPWLARYGPGQPADLAPEHDSALAMFRATAARVPDRPAVHYLDDTLTQRFGVGHASHVLV